MGNDHQICGLVLPVSLQERLSSSSNEEKSCHNNILVYALHAALLYELLGQCLGTEAEPHSAEKQGTKWHLLIPRKLVSTRANGRVVKWRRTINRRCCLCLVLLIDVCAFGRPWEVYPNQRFRCARWGYWRVSQVWAFRGASSEGYILTLRSAMYDRNTWCISFAQDGSWDAVHLTRSNCH